MCMVSKRRELFWGVGGDGGCIGLRGTPFSPHACVCTNPLREDRERESEKWHERRQKGGGESCCTENDSWQLPPPLDETSVRLLVSGQSRVGRKNKRWGRRLSGWMDCWPRAAAAAAAAAAGQR